MKKILITAALILFIGGGIFVKLRTQKHEVAVHYHAGFMVYIDGKREDFSLPQYMSVKPCNVNGKEEKHTDEDEQMEKAHLHDGIGDVVHVHRAGVKWRDLFANIQFSFPVGKKVVAYENGALLPGDSLERAIKPNESIIIVVGDKDNIDLEKAVEKQYIIDVAKSSETCGPKSN